ncbi:MAG: ATP-dependent DNA ligase, partial [Henriciella sp.]
MQSFSELLERLILTPSRNGKIALLVNYFTSEVNPARGWTLAVLTGELDLPGVKGGTIRKLITERTDPELFRLSYDYVGDLAETVSLMWPGQRGANRVPPIDDVVESLMGATRAQGERLVAGYLDMLDPRQRWALLKMVTGGLRIGVSARLTKVALAEMGGVDPAEIEEIWHGLEPPYESLFDWLDGTASKPSPDIDAPYRPVML